MMDDEKCPECGSTAPERLLGMQMVEMLAGTSERAKAQAKPDDPIRLLRRMAAEFGYDLTERPEVAPDTSWVKTTDIRKVHP